MTVHYLTVRPKHLIRVLETITLRNRPLHLRDVYPTFIRCPPFSVVPVRWSVGTFWSLVVRERVGEKSSDIGIFPELSTDNLIISKF